MKPKTWVYNPHKQKRIISDEIRMRVQHTCDEFVLEYLWPLFARPFNPKNKKEMQCVDIEWKWYRHFIYFKARYKDLRHDAIATEYEYPVARLEYMNGDVFHLAYFRHTEEWWTITYGKGESLSECLKLIRELPHFHPVT